MDKTIKKILNKTIEREFDNISGNFEGPLRRNPELKERMDESDNLREELKEKLLQVLPIEYKKMLDDFEEACDISALVEARIMFKEGLFLGLTELSYLSEIGQEIVLI